MTPTHIVIHDTDSPYGDGFSVNTWHESRGFKYVHKSTGAIVNVGYHWLVLNGYLLGSEIYHGQCDGQLVRCRPDYVEGAHAKAKGMNSKSLGVAFVGPAKEGPQFTPAQMASGSRLVLSLMNEHSIPIMNVVAHHEVDGMKKDPRFNMDIFRSFLRIAI